MSGSMKGNRKLIIGLSVALVFAIVAGFLIIKHYFFQETLLQAAERVLHGMQNYDATLLMSYVSDEEKKLANLNEDNLQRFLDEFVKPRLKGFRPNGQVETLSYTLQGGLDLRQEYKHPDGRKTELYSTVMITENGIKTLNLTRNLFLWALATEWQPDKPFPHGEEKMQFFADTIIKYKDQLEKTGLRGIVQASGKDLDRKFYTWDELAEMYLDIKRKIEESRARSGQAAH